MIFQILTEYTSKFEKYLPDSAEQDIFWSLFYEDISKSFMTQLQMINSEIAKDNGYTKLTRFFGVVNPRYAIHRDQALDALKNIISREQLFFLESRRNKNDHSSNIKDHITDLKAVLADPENEAVRTLDDKQFNYVMSNSRVRML